jgi:TolB-like protein/Flp pilus assembly protein TadD
MRTLPPLKALRAFEAAARHLSFKAAAEELNLTPTAISHQIRLLETVLDQSLFRRRPRPLTLTSTGAALFPIVRRGFDSIADAFATVSTEVASRRLRAATTAGSSSDHDPRGEGVDAVPGPETSADPAPSDMATPERLAPTATQSAPRLSIVVLPFANIGGDHAQEYFVDGITESLTTDLSRISGAFVIARNTAFAYKGKAIDLRQLGRDLNVRYALEGSVQRGDTRLRVNVQLIDCNTGTQLWAERFDQRLADLFEMQDEIVARFAGQSGAQLVEAEARRAERSPDPDSMDLYFRARALINRGSTAEYLKPAEALLERALALDPNNVDALAAKGWVDLDLGGGFMTDDRAGRLASAEAAAIKALSLAPNHAWAHLVLGSVYSDANRGAEGIAEFERALMLDRNLAYALALIGMAKTGLGRAEEAEGHYREALRLSPYDVSAHHWMSGAGTSKLHLGKHEEAVTWFRRAIEANRNFAFTHLSLAAALAHLDRIDEACAAAKSGLALEPSFTIGRFRAGARSDNPVYLSGRERVYEGMRRAGIPD